MRYSSLILPTLFIVTQASSGDSGKKEGEEMVTLLTGSVYMVWHLLWAPDQSPASRGTWSRHQTGPSQSDPDRCRVHADVTLPPREDTAHCVSDGHSDSLHLWERVPRLTRPEYKTPWRPHITPVDPAVMKSTWNSSHCVWSTRIRYWTMPALLVCLLTLICESSSLRGRSKLINFTWHCT